MSNNIVPNFKVLSCKPIVPSNGTTLPSYSFDPQQDLQNKKIVGITCYCGALDAMFDVNNPGVPLLPMPFFMDAYLTIYNAATTNKNMATGQQEAGLFYDRIPLCQLRSVNTYVGAGLMGASSSNDVFWIRPTEFNWTKTAVIFPTGLAIGDTTFGLMFGIYYLDENDNGDWWLSTMGVDIKQYGKK